MYSQSPPARLDSRKSELSAPSGRKAPYRFVLWAVLAVALLMLTTFVLFGASGQGMLKTAAATACFPNPYSSIT